MSLPDNVAEMDLPENVGGRDRLARALLAVVLTVAAIRSLRNGKRVRGLLAGIGALAFGFNATTKYCGANDALDIDTTGDEVSLEINEPGEETDSNDEPASVAPTHDQESQLTCAACGDPIVVGEWRGPNENDEIVHDDCQ